MNPGGLNELAALWASAMLRACWQGALAVGLVWLLSRLLPRLSLKVRAALWWLVCAKLLLGAFALPGLSVAVLPAESPAPITAIPVSLSATELEQVPSVKSPVHSLATPITPAASVRFLAVERSMSERLRPSALLFLLWSAGVLVQLALAAWEYCRVRRLIAGAHPCTDLTLLSKLSATEGLRHIPPVLVSKALPGSLVVGLYRPRIVLAEADLSELAPDEKWALLAHELAHIRRRDLWLGMLTNLARLVFFFHPFVWLACREYELAREAACDAESLRVSGLPHADYGRLLLKLSLPPAGGALRPGAAALGVASPHGRILLRRLQGLQKLKTEGALPQWCSLLVLALVGLLLSLTPTRAKLRPWVVPPAAVTAKASAQLAEVAARELGNPIPVSEELPVATKARAISPLEKKRKSVMKVSVKSSSHLSRAVTAAAALATVSAPGMLGVKPASAQENPPIPPVPPTPAVAPVALKLAAAPEPALVPAPEAPRLAALQAGKYQYTLRMGTSYSTHVIDKATALGQRKLAEAQPGDCMVVDRDGKRYVITDAATLRQIKDNYAAIEARGRQMELKGKEMEKISAPMEDLGKQMEALGKIMEAHGKELGVLGEKMGTVTTEAEREAIKQQMKVLQEQMKLPSDEMRALGKKMREHGDQMRTPGDQMRELGNQMRAAVKQAEERTATILDNAFKNGRAVEQASSTGAGSGEISLE